VYDLKAARYLSIGEAAWVLGVCTKTLRRWDKRGILKPGYRTAGFHRRYDRLAIGDALKKGFGEGAPKRHIEVAADIKPRCAIYGRVSSSKQKKGGDLRGQVEDLRDYCKGRGYEIVREYTDVGSGINDSRKGLLKLLRDAANGRLDVVVVNYNDRLARFGLRIIREYLKSWGVGLDIKNPTVISEDSYSELVTDLTAILYSFMGKLYRIRRTKKS